MDFEVDSYRTFLRTRLAEATAQNPRFSLRAFARKLGIGASTLSEVLSGRKNISRETAARIAQVIGLDRDETELFCDLVDFEAAKTPELKAVVLKRLSVRRLKPTFYSLSLDLFQLIADWYHVPILEMASLTNFTFEPKAAARRLGISPVEAEVALERLKRLNLLKRDPSGGAWVKTNDSTLAESKIPNEALRKFHRQMLGKAVESLTSQTSAEKKIGSETFAFDPEQLPEVEGLMEDFFRQVTALAGRSKKKTDIYHLGVQFFNLTHDRNHGLSDKENS